MRTFALMIAISIAPAAAGAAQPANAPVQKTQPAADDPVVVLASAPESKASPPAPQQNATDPVKPVRHARVTTCRCGDQNPSE